MAIFEDHEFGLVKTDEPIPPKIDIKKEGDKGGVNSLENGLRSHAATASASSE